MVCSICHTLPLQSVRLCLLRWEHADPIHQRRPSCAARRWLAPRVSRPPGPAGPTAVMISITCRSRRRSRSARRPDAARPGPDAGDGAACSLPRICSHPTEIPRPPKGKPPLPSGHKPLTRPALRTPTTITTVMCHTPDARGDVPPGWRDRRARGIAIRGHDDECAQAHRRVWV